VRHEAGQGHKTACRVLRTNLHVVKAQGMEGLYDLLDDGIAAREIQILLQEGTGQAQIGNDLDARNRHGNKLDVRRES
jgi:hypothetical protein